MNVSGNAASHAGMRHSHTSQTLAANISANQSSTVLNNSQAMDIQTPMPDNDEMSNNAPEEVAVLKVENEENNLIKKAQLLEDLNMSSQRTTNA